MSAVRGSVVWIGWRVYPLALLAGIWYLLTALDIIDEFSLPTPTAVWERGVEMWGDDLLQPEILTTLGRIFLAFGLALVVGVIVGIAIGRSRLVRDGLRPVVGLLFPTPKVALYPAMLIILGLGSSSKVGLGFAEGVFPILVATAAAASQVESRLVWSARTLGMSERSVLLKIVLPASLPGILTGARIGLVGSLIGVFLGEMIAGSDGLGQMMVRSWNLLETPEMYVSIVTIGIIGLILDQLLLLARQRLLAWSAEEGR